MKKHELVRLRTRPSRDGETFTYTLDYVDPDGKRRYRSLGHADKRKAEKQRAQTERELRMGVMAAPVMRLSQFLADSLERTRGQVRESTLAEQDTAMRHLIECIGDIDCDSVCHRHGERFVQACLDRGNSLGTARKKIKTVRRVLQMAVLRGILERNPFEHVSTPRVAQQEVHVYTDDECHRMLRAARERSSADQLNWELLIALALCTGMRRGEALNTTWRDVDFDGQVVNVSPKKNTDATWEWHIKDSERRTLPLTDSLVELLLQHHEGQSEGSVYLFVPTWRYKRIQARRSRGSWTARDGRCPINNFTRKFEQVLLGAGIEVGQFHDLRRTCLTRWFENGLAEYDVMKLAGHSDFETTHRFYLSVRQDLVDRARVASTAAMKDNFVARLWRAPFEDDDDKTTAERKSLAAQDLGKYA